MLHFSRSLFSALLPSHIKQLVVRNQCRSRFKSYSESSKHTTHPSSWWLVIVTHHSGPRLRLPSLSFLSRSSGRRPPPRAHHLLTGNVHTKRTGRQAPKGQDTRKKSKRSSERCTMMCYYQCTEPLARLSRPTLCCAERTCMIEIRQSLLACSRISTSRTHPSPPCYGGQ